MRYSKIAGLGFELIERLQSPELTLWASMDSVCSLDLTHESNGPAIAVVLILAVRNLGAGHAPAKRCGNDDQGGRGTNSFGPAHHGSLPLFIDDAVRYRPALKGRIG